MSQFLSVILTSFFMTKADEDLQTHFRDYWDHVEGVDFNEMEDGDFMEQFAWFAQESSAPAYVKHATVAIEYSPSRVAEFRESGDRYGWNPMYQMHIHVYLEFDKLVSKKMLMTDMGITDANWDRSVMTAKFSPLQREGMKYRSGREYLLKDPVMPSLTFTWGVTFMDEYEIKKGDRQVQREERTVHNASKASKRTKELLESIRACTTLIELASVAGVQHVWQYAKEVFEINQVQINVSDARNPDRLEFPNELPLFAEVRALRETLHSRKIMLLVDPQGNTGKSVAYRIWCCKHKYDVIMNGSDDDMYQQIMNNNPGESASNFRTRIVINLTRQNKELNFGFVERMMDGLVSTKKYRGGTIRFPTGCKIVVFCNEVPPGLWDESGLSRDRPQVAYLSGPLSGDPADGLKWLGHGEVVCHHSAPGVDLSVQRSNFWGKTAAELPPPVAPVVAQAQMDIANEPDARFAICDDGEYPEDEDFEPDSSPYDYE